jgi:hypothetical protein
VSNIQNRLVKSSTNVGVYNSVGRAPLLILGEEEIVYNAKVNYNSSDRMTSVWFLFPVLATSSI